MMFSPEVMRITLVVGVILGMLFYERFQLTTGGAIVPPYLALAVASPLSVVVTTLTTPGGTPHLTDTPPADTLTEGAHPLAVAIARLAAGRIGTDQPRPAPLYLRDADAAPPSEAPPALLD